MKTEFSAIIAGTMRWGTWGKNLDKIEMSKMILKCISNQITSFDHADIYGDYSTENDFGEALKFAGVNRHEIQLITKCGIQLPSENRKVTIKHYDYSKAHIVKSVENSLRNLQTDYLDLLLLHRPSPLMNPEIIGETIATLKKEGKIKDFGVSNFSSGQIGLISHVTEISVNQIQFSASHLMAMSDGSIDFMMQNRIKIMAWNPLGNIFSKSTPQHLRIRKIAESLATKYKVDSSIILLTWILKHPSGIIPICGTTNPDRIAGLMKATKITLEIEDWFAIWSASLGTEVP